MNIDLLKKILLTTTAAGAGGATGYYVTPKLLGYEDSPASRNLSALADASWAAAMMRPGVATKLGPAGMFSTWGLSQGVPVAHQWMTRPDPPTATEQATSILSTPTARGAGMGAAAAGLGGILTGLMRQKEDPEDSRAGMVAKDALKYLIPAMLAGGTIGSLTGQQ